MKDVGAEEEKTKKDAEIETRERGQGRGPRCGRVRDLAEWNSYCNWPDRSGKTRPTHLLGLFPGSSAGGGGQVNYVAKKGLGHVMSPCWLPWVCRPKSIYAIHMYYINISYQ